MLSIPDRESYRTKFADWLELCCVQATDGRIGFATLVSASDMGREDQAEDIAEDDLRDDDFVISVQVEIEHRYKAIGADYPFRVDTSGRTIEMVSHLTLAGAVYLFCLFLSHANDPTIIPQSLAPQVDNATRDLFQACATVAAAGYVDGVAMSFGWPRPEGEAFLAALHRIYKLFGDGKPHSKPRPAAPSRVKDEGIDIIAWRPSSDGLPGTQYVLGQVASGQNWTQKSVAEDADAFHDYWFERRPATRHQNAMFMPFCIEPPPNRECETYSQEELLRDHVQRLTSRFGVVIYRYRMAQFAAKGIGIHQQGSHAVERVGDLSKVVEWVNNYLRVLRAI